MGYFCFEKEVSQLRVPSFITKEDALGPFLIIGKINGFWVESMSGLVKMRYRPMCTCSLLCASLHVLGLVSSWVCMWRYCFVVSPTSSAANLPRSPWSHTVNWCNVNEHQTCLRPVLPASCKYHACLTQWMGDHIEQHLAQEQLIQLIWYVRPTTWNGPDWANCQL